MRRSNQRQKCRSESARDSGSSSEPEVEKRTQKNELPGVDYKNKLGPRSLRLNKLNLNTDEGESRFLNNVKKELNKRENIQKIQTAFQDDTALKSKTIWCTNQNMSIGFDSPLDGISLPHYVEKWKNPGLIKEAPARLEEGDEEEDGKVAAHVKPTVLAVNMKWRNGIQVKKCHKFTTRTINLEPVMKKTEFDFENKTKLAGQVRDAVEELFPESVNKLMVLDGNGGGSKTEALISSSKVARSDKLRQDNDASAACQGTGAGNPYAREWKEYTDLEEHNILAIPSYSRNGFDVDPGKKYEFPYDAKFVIGRKVYHHKFLVQVPLTKSPQHYGLIFTFSEDAKGHSKLRIKSLLTIYSMLPISPRFACLETYEKNNLEGQANESTSPNSKKKMPNSSAREARKAVQLVTENLQDDKLLTSACGGGFFMERNLTQPAQDHLRYRRLHDDALTGKKDKKKRQILKNMDSEQAGNDTVISSRRAFRKM